MSRPEPVAPLRLVRPATKPVDELLAALENWAASGPDGEPVAYLEVGDGELFGDFPLTVAKVTELASLLRHAAELPHHPEGDQS